MQRPLWVDLSLKFICLIKVFCQFFFLIYMNSSSGFSDSQVFVFIQTLPHSVCEAAYQNSITLAAERVNEQGDMQSRYLRWQVVCVSDMIRVSQVAL